MRRLNIWYLSAHDQPKGQSSRTYDFACELVKRGHQVTMFTNSYCHWTHVDRLGHDEKWRIEEIEGIRVVWLRTVHYKDNGLKRGLNMISNVWRSLQVTRTLSDNPDVVIGPSVPLGTGWAASRIAKKKQAAFIFEVRDVWPTALVDDGGLSKRNPVYCLFRLIEKYLYRNAQRISATLPFIFDHVSNSGSDPKKVTWIPNGVNFDRFAGFDLYNGGEQNSIVAMYIGGFGTAHDVLTIVRAAKILQEKGNDNIQFIIVGNGPKRPECKQEASKYGSKNIEFRNPVAKSDVPQLQLEADVLLACVLDSEAYRFGLNLNKIFDYFASGRPVIFSGNAPNDPIIASGAGFSIAPEDPDELVLALEKYIEMSPTDRIRMGERGREYVEKEFDMQILGNRMEALIFQSIIDRKKGNMSAIHAME